MTRTQRISLCLVMIGAGIGIGCQGRELNLFGYSSAPPFDPDIRTVYIPPFKNIAYHTGPNRGIEADLTEAIVRELGKRRSPMRVTSDPANADTELIGTITAIQKNVLNRNLQNYAREIEFVVSAEVVWRDLRSGQPLTDRRVPIEAPPIPFDPSLPRPPDAPPPAAARPVTVTEVGRGLPELGESNASAQKDTVDKLARRIVDLMETPWSLQARPAVQ